MTKSILPTSALILCITFCVPVLGQSNKKRTNNKIDSATLKGRIVQNDRKEFEIDIEALNPQLNQQIPLPEPPIPKNWTEMSIDQKKSWVEKFEASDKGKAFLQNRKKVAESAARFELKVDDDGNFVVYDVPHGVYGMRGRLEKEMDDKTFVFEVFGQIQIKDEVEEVLLDPVMVSVTRILKMDEPLPAFKVPTFDGKASIVNGLLKDKNILLNFWSLDSPPSIDFAKTIQETYNKIKAEHNLQLISVCIGGDARDALNHVQSNKFYGWHGHAKDWQHPIVDLSLIHI